MGPFSQKNLKFCENMCINTSKIYIYIYIYLARTPEIGQGLGRILSCGARKPERVKYTIIKYISRPYSGLLRSIFRISFLVHTIKNMYP